MTIHASRAADDDRLELHLLRELDRLPDLARAVRGEDRRLLSRDDAVERREHDVVAGAGQGPILLVRRVRRAVRLGVAEQRADGIELPLARARLLLRVRAAALLLREEGAEAAAPPTEAGGGQVHDERAARHDGHLGHGPAGEVHDRGLAGDEAPGRTGDDVRDAADARDADVRAVRVEPVDGLRVRVEAPRLRVVDRGVGALRDLREAHARAGVHHAGPHGEAGRVDHRRACGHGKSLP
jgi:hypothetical protein